MRFTIKAKLALTFGLVILLSIAAGPRQDPKELGERLRSVTDVGKQVDQSQSDSQQGLDQALEPVQALQDRVAATPGLSS
jgi:hypothetical protein